MSEKQRTIKNPVSISGIGLHTGNEVTITFKPAPENYGYKFRRTDLTAEILVDADVDHVVDTSRGTSIEQDGVRIDTIEHVLAALAGLQIDNCSIELNKSETPILDGSSRLYVEALLSAGIVEQKELRQYHEISSNITYLNEEKKVELIVIPSKDFRVSVMIDFESKVLQSQNATLQSLSQFEHDFASCRTFVFLHELEYLVNNNLIKGGDLSNAIVFVDRDMSRAELDHLAHLFNKPRIEVQSEGILNNLDLQFPNEPARHKLLDLIGDLALVGMPIKGHVIATRPGHYSNVQFAKLIKKQLRKERQTGQVPKFDTTKPPIFDVNQIKNLLPHRPPFLFIEKVIEMGTDHIVGVKNVTINESFFVGHFPEEPVMPGVLLIEALAQSGGILAASTLDDPQNYRTLFVKIENVKFRHKVVPGDTLVFFCQLSGPMRRGLIIMKGAAYVGDKVVMEAEMIAQLQRK
ncbi:MAG TPA: bifunctional UDP-3-O-[3-hydroxymyristoyl] N-acetylglucosamine deacetylase/3-hydroxyacyl-ACP dehydratase [Bacteroidales bacterium]|nr:bifunctional UDP-3-O-[3-hydroxymyristoyl] N-acetylglucosamine deacetylase/3-hydroxyacyl-ACP dehydratase [Bacteroidales bacterium]